MKKCPKCGEEYGDGATYCEKCGTKLVKYRACPKCGQLVNDEVLYCPKCGQAIDGDVIDIRPVPEKVVERKKPEVNVERLESEIANYRRRKRGMTIAGSILLGIGSGLFTLFLILIVNLPEKVNDPGFVNLYLFYIFGLVITELMIDAGIVLLIVQSAVFNKKIGNRQRLIDEAKYK